MNEAKWSGLKNEIQFKFSRSSGPGGQHVNTTESKAELWWSVSDSSVFSERQKQRIKAKLKNFINKDGYVHLSHERYRSREQNKKACLNRLRYLLEQALRKEKKRKKTKPTKASIEKRLKEKKMKGEKKRWRQKLTKN